MFDVVMYFCTFGYHTFVLVMAPSGGLRVGGHLKLLYAVMANTNKLDLI